MSPAMKKIRIAQARTADVTSRRTFLSMILFSAALLFAAALYVTPALADSLDAAKARGDVGEKRNGYVGIVISGPSGDLVRLVDDVNLRRRDAYRALAQKTQGATLAAVEQMAGAKLIQNAASGTYVEDGSGKWVRKP